MNMNLFMGTLKMWSVQIKKAINRLKKQNRPIRDIAETNEQFD